MEREPILNQKATLLEAIKIIESYRKTIAVIIDNNRIPLGVISDGDIRRALLKGHGLYENVNVAMNKRPRTAHVHQSESHLLGILKRYGLEAIPLVDDNNTLIRVIHISDLLDEKEIQTDSITELSFAVIMAGGEGRRLLPLTQEIPKPMVQVGGMPILERQIRFIRQWGIKKIYITLNYLGEIIEAYFKDGHEWDVEIHYLYESKKLGTAGALSLLSEFPDDLILVINGDVLTNCNYQKMIDFHRQHRSLITAGAIHYQIDIPYGVFKTSGIKAISLEEKPSQRFLCNAGMYILSPESLNMIPKDCYYNMTDLIEQGFKEKKKISVFPIHEYWTDIGTHSELEKARKDIMSLNESNNIFS